jgi:membrane protein
MFVKEGVPRNTYDTIYKIINDILCNSDSLVYCLLDFLLSILMANGPNGILGGFQTTRHVLIKQP